MTPQELKNSILQLAIQGKLVPQRPEEGNAEELYKQIQAEKQKLIKEGKIKKEKPLPAITDDEKPFEIPASWKWVRLGEIATVLGGKRIPAGRKLTTENTGHIYIRVSDMKDDFVSTNNLMYVPHDIYSTISKYIINKEDIYITVAGTIGRVGKIPPGLNGANLTENADRLVFSVIDQNWFIDCLKSSAVQSQITNVTTKVGQPKLAIKRIQELTIPLPPLAEQKRIVAKIEELLPYVERYEAAYNKLQQLNKRFPDDLQKSVLQLAIQGRLVPQRAEEGNAEDLYKQIQTEKQKLIKEGKIKKEKLLPPITDDEKPFEIPASWKWVRFGEIIKYYMGKTPPRAEEEWWGNDVPWVSIADMPESGHIVLTKEKVTKSALLKKFGNKISKAGTLLMSFKLTIGKVSILDIDAVHNEAIISIFPYIDKDEILKIYLFNILPYITNYGETKNAIKGKTLNSNSINNLILPLPSLAEQKRIVGKLEKILPLCDKLKITANFIKINNKGRC